MDFRQTFVTGASRDRDELIAFSGQKVKVQGHTAAEAHSTRRYCRVQLFLVFISCLFFCLTVCLLDYAKRYEQILMKALEGWGVAQGTIY